MKRIITKIINEETIISFDIKEIERRLSHVCDYTDIDQFIEDWCEDLTPEEISKNYTTIAAAVYNHNNDIMKDELELNITDILNKHIWSNWYPTKEQLIEAINEYYE